MATPQGTVTIGRYSRANGHTNLTRHLDRTVHTHHLTSSTGWQKRGTHIGDVTPPPPRPTPFYPSLSRLGSHTPNHTAYLGQDLDNSLKFINHYHNFLYAECQLK
ncbi:Hypothetical predicted protein [Pelobates cultripes]|uniref:Uncharacterized protein n=1 Tax=Pelobates cultripes TaxID=61616 RepID=A0AAD1SSS0_PELCU|nr:Hypothetical predicted protein [Pelobates cultripes]